MISRCDPECVRSVRGVTLREDPPSVTSLTPEMEPGVDAPDLLPRRVFFFFFPPPKPPFGITLARRTAPAAPSASAASTLASMRLCDSSLPAPVSYTHLTLPTILLV